MCKSSRYFRGTRSHGTFCEIPRHSLAAVPKVLPDGTEPPQNNRPLTRYAERLVG